MIHFALVILLTFLVAAPFIWAGWMTGKTIDRIRGRK